MHYAPPNAEHVQRLAHWLGTLGYRVTTTLYEDESVRLVARTAGHVIKIGLGVPW
jgi:hypothetical protein